VIDFMIAVGKAVKPAMPKGGQLALSEVVDHRDVRRVGDRGSSRPAIRPCSCGGMQARPSGLPVRRAIPVSAHSERVILPPFNDFDSITSEPYRESYSLFLVLLA